MLAVVFSLTSVTNRPQVFTLSPSTAPALVQAPISPGPEDNWPLIGPSHNACPHALPNCSRGSCLKFGLQHCTLVIEIPHQLPAALG